MGMATLGLRIHRDGSPKNMPHRQPSINNTKDEYMRNSIRDVESEIRWRPLILCEVYVMILRMDIRGEDVITGQR